MKKTITKKFTFEASHKLFDNDLSHEENEKCFGACRNHHGHSYKLFVSVSGEEKNGMIINFSKLKEIVNKYIIDVFDHSYINHLELMVNQLSTCENMVNVFWNQIDGPLQKENVFLEKIKLYETEGSYCELVR